MFKYKVIFALLVIFFIPFLNAKAESVGISVDQSVFVLSLAPGSSREIKVNVKSLAKAPQTMILETSDFVIRDDNSVVQMTEKNEQFGMKDWISFEQKNWLLSSGQSQEIILKVTVPNEATVGGHWAIANIKVFPEINGQNFHQTIVGGQVGIYLLLNVQGAALGAGNLKKFSAPLLAKEDSLLSIDYENTGNILYMPQGKINIKNLLTRRQQTIEAEKHFVFPGKNFSFNVPWSPESILGIYIARAVFVDANGNISSAQRILFGKMFFITPLIVLFIFFSAAKKYMRITKSKTNV